MKACVLNPTGLSYVLMIHIVILDIQIGKNVEAKNSNEWNKWLEAICTKFKNMEDEKFWKVIL
jgi:hypothetical protein